jgi:DNA-binding transcriptional MerR regulator
MVKYYSSKETSDRLGICRKTLQSYADKGLINFIRTEGGWRKYDIETYLGENNQIEKNECMLL